MTRLIGVCAATAFAASLGGSIVSAGAQEKPVARSAWTPPRTPWGHPDLQGVYSNNEETGIPFERPAQFEGRRISDFSPAELEQIVRKRNEQFKDSVAGTEWAGGLRPPTHLIFDSFDRKNSRPWLVVDPPDGKIPSLTAEGQQRVQEQFQRGGSNFNPRGPFNGPEDLGLYDRCITRGIPFSMMPAGYGANYEIVQGPNYIAIVYEMVHETRVIPLETRPHVGDKLREYLGDARGRWEGNTLVVETTNFTDKTGFRGSSQNLRLVERFTPTASNVVEWTVTFEDPTTWTRPWTFAMSLSKLDQSQQVYEYACHEGNYGMRNILSGARAEEGR